MQCAPCERLGPMSVCWPMCVNETLRHPRRGRRRVLDFFHWHWFIQCIFRWATTFEVCPISMIGSTMLRRGYDLEEDFDAWLLDCLGCFPPNFPMCAGSSLTCIGHCLNCNRRPVGCRHRTVRNDRRCQTFLHSKNSTLHSKNGLCNRCEESP